MEVPEEGKKYTWADLLTWPEGRRYELIEGKPRLRTGESLIHQAACVELSRQIANFLVGKPCKAYSAPFDAPAAAKSRLQS